MGAKGRFWPVAEVVDSGEKVSLAQRRYPS